MMSKSVNPILDQDWRHCCKEMRHHIAAGELPLYFFKRDPEYGIKYPARRGGGYPVMHYCPR